MNRLHELTTISAKIGICCGTCLAVTALLLIVTAWREQRREIQDSARTKLEQIAAEQAQEVRDLVGEALVASRTLAQGAAVQCEATSGAAVLTREALIQQLRMVLERNPSFLGVYSCWEPNAFDGRDTEYVGAPGHNAEGLLVPYWNRGADGILALETIDDPDDATLDANGQRESEDYLTPRETLREAIMDPYAWEVQGKEVLMITASAPIVHQGKFKGISAIDIPIDKLQGCADKLDVYDKTGQMAIISQNGIIAALSGKPDLLGKPLKDWRGNEAQELKRLIKAGETTLREDAENIEILVPARMGQSEMPWAVMLWVPKSKVFAPLRAAGLKMLTLAALLIGIGLFVMHVIARQISRPIISAASLAAELASGDGDLTRRMRVDSKDELAVLANHINQFISNIQQLVRYVVATSEEVERAAVVIQSGAEAAAQSFHEQSDQTGQITAAIEEMTAAASDVMQQMEETAHVAEQGSEDARRGREVVQSTISGMEAIELVSRESLVSVNELGRRGEMIGEIVDVINGIADQTNLLALNAAIEAARAGDQGRGFAVVADEVRRLAQRTGEATRQIGDSIVGVRQDIELTMQGMERGSGCVEQGVRGSAATGEMFERLLERFNETAQRMATVAASNTEQLAATEEIRNKVVGIHRLSSQNIEELDGTVRQAQSMRKASAQLLELTSRFRV